jgi:hypothetical protein
MNPFFVFIFAQWSFILKIDLPFPPSPGGGGKKISVGVILAEKIKRTEKKGINGMKML